MKIVEIEIENYKSIKNLVIPMSDDYGESNTVFLLGLNESGKSSILDAIYQLQTAFDGDNYYALCHKSCQKQDEEIRITARARLTDEEYSQCVDLLKQRLPNLGDDIKKFTGIEVIKSVTLNKEAPGKSSEPRVTLDEDFIVGKYKYVGGVITPADSGVESASEEESENIESSIMNIDQMKQIIMGNIEHLVKFPVVLSWKSSPEHLMMHEINLREFQENQNLSIPLKNIFSLYLYGKKEASDVQKTIDWALGTGENKAELEEDLSYYATKHINSVWKEHLINIKVKIDGDLISVLVEDKDAARTFLSVEQRSDGFKQFISLLLTLSAEHHGEILKNNVLLLDEPEARLHPSGARFMRDEIFEIGRSNQIFVATHSPVMVDIDTPQRHWIVKKEKLETHLQVIGMGASMKDEEVMQMAFGINIMKEILPDNLLLVEGEMDKKLLEFSLRKLKGKPISVKSAQGSKIPTLANILDSHDINTVIFLDADDAGRKMQKTIIENRSSFNENNVFILSNLIDDIPEYATIEDLIPPNSVQKCLQSNNWSYNFTANKDVRILAKIASANPQYAKDKNAMFRIKLQMAEQAIKDYSSDNEKEYDRLFKLAKVLLEKMYKAKRP